ncbi:MAG: TIGR03790 family protein [Bacteroidales bacterium]|nr:TIGR03790 family protein [Bacteroidales bacterium]MCF8386250.1 TIGR03790 family protein [Bacteroidales bacterium]MCF8397503.1 TIGR03790 family protein [Bacteroidales bacterium]
MKKLSALIVLSSILFPVISQNLYDDVAVIMNYNSETSIEIGTYFAVQRSIPDENLIYIDCLTEEVVDTTEFRNICNQILDQLEENNLETSINYLVTTRGIPVNVSYGDSCTGFEGLHCRSLDNQLTLLNSSLVDDPVGEFYIENPYYASVDNFSSEIFDFFLISRLDGMNPNSVLSMIDKSGPHCPVVKEEAQTLVDFVHPDTNVVDLFSRYFEDALEFLDYNDWSYQFDPDTQLISQQDDLLMYTNMIYDSNVDQPEFTWLNGSFVNTILTYTDLGFYAVGEEIPYSLLNLMNSGASGGGGYANVYFASEGPKQELLYSRYLNDTSEKRYNLAESYYASVPRLSYQYILIGDPKTSLDIVYAGQEDHELVMDRLHVYPNPGSGDVNLDFHQDVRLKSIIIYNQYGQSVYQEDPGMVVKKHKINLRHLSAGLYFLRIQPEMGNLITQKLIIR